MRVLRMSLALVLLATSAIGQDRPTKQYTIEEFLDTTAVRGASFSPDGSRILVSTDESGIFNAYALPVDGSTPVQLTHSTTDSIFARSYFPNDERFVYQADQGGNELTHVYVQAADGTVTDITPGDKLKASFAGWADDEKSFFVSSNERDPKYFDLYEVQADGYERAIIFKNETGYNISSVSPDKRYIALNETITRANSNAFIYDRETEEVITLLDGPEEAVRRPVTFSEDGTQLYCLTDLGHEFQYLVAHDISEGKLRIVEKIDWDISYAQLSKSGRYLSVGINHDARSEIRIYDTSTDAPLSLPEIDGATIASATFSRDESALAFYVQGGRTPGDLYYYSLNSGGMPKQLTHRLSKAIDPEDLVEPEVVRFASYDGTIIPGVLYRPHQANSSSKLPALVQVHGGPGGQTRASYNPLTQYLVNHGYVVYGINNRGSSGYGKTFYAMDDLKHGDADLDDCVASKQMLIDTGYVDPERIGILGGSYGGYMVCAALAFRPEEFEVGVNIFGVTNWVRTLKSIPSWWEATRNALYKELGDPFTQEAYLHKISPLFHAENIVRPMIVLQGANDPRVLQVESDEMVAAVRANDVPVEYVIFPDEGHGFRKKENIIKGNKAILEFLDTYLKDHEGR